MEIDYCPLESFVVGSRRAITFDASGLSSSVIARIDDRARPLKVSGVQEGATVRKTGSIIEIAGLSENDWRKATSSIYADVTISVNGDAIAMSLVDRPPAGFGKAAAAFTKSRKTPMTQSEQNRVALRAGLQKAYGRQTRKFDDPDAEDVENLALQHVLGELKDWEADLQFPPSDPTKRGHLASMVHTAARHFHVDEQRLMRAALMAAFGNSDTEEKMQKFDNPPLRKAMSKVYENKGVIRTASFSKSSGGSLEQAIAGAGLAKSSALLTLGKGLEITRQHARHFSRRVSG
jgi:hypothetical protein